jgi:hypothetical protein
MYLRKLLIILFCHSSLAILQFLYPKQTFELPNNPSNWICTVHITVATFANYTTSDITERFLASNRENIIPTVSTMLNRSISIAPVNSFYEPCTISVLIDATIHGSSYLFNGHQLYRYFRGNEYVFSGWRHSIIILIYFSCYNEYHILNFYVPHRLFYHSLDCGQQNIFPNQAFVFDPLHHLRNMSDPTHSIFDRQLPFAMRRSIPTTKYGWDDHNPSIKPGQCLDSRWDRRSHVSACGVRDFAVQHYENFLNFTAVGFTLSLDKQIYYGELLTGTKYYSVRNSISFNAIDAINARILYCDQTSDPLRLRPINLSSPFGSATWVMLVSFLILFAIARTFRVLDMRSVVYNQTTIIFIKTIFSSLTELIICLLEKDIGKNNCTKAFIGLIGICLGNTYKNYLTIELVFPRAGDTINNFTELLDLNFNVLVRVHDIEYDKSADQKYAYGYLEIDETKREKYVSEEERWLKITSDSDEEIIKELASVKSKNAWIFNAPHYLQVYYLNLINDRHYPLSCHFVKRPFAHLFHEFHFFNPKAEEFKLWTAKFLDHGLFEFWKRLESHTQTLFQREFSLENRSKRSNSSLVEAADAQNFIGQIHLIAFYIVIGIITAICVAIFLLECAMQNAQALSLFVLQKFTHFSLQLLWTIVRSVFLMSRLIGHRCQNRQPF